MYNISGNCVFFFVGFFLNKVNLVSTFSCHLILGMFLIEPSWTHGPARMWDINCSNR